MTAVPDRVHRSHPATPAHSLTPLARPGSGGDGGEQAGTQSTAVVLSDTPAQAGVQRGRRGDSSTTLRFARNDRTVIGRNHGSVWSSPE